MSVQILPAEGNFASNFGSGLGQGLSQQLPEEIKRYRLSKGLENLGKQNIQDPYQLVSQLATIPGIDPGLLGILAPLLQSQIGRQQAGAGFGNEPSNLPAGLSQPQPTGIQPKTNEPRLTPLGANPPEAEPINQLATNLLRHQPFNYPNIQAATAESERRIGNVEDQFDKQTMSFLQKHKELAEGEVGGQILSLMKQKAVQDLVRTGASERSIAQKYARQATEIAKEYGSIAGIKDQVGIFTRPNEGTIKSIRHAGERLKTLGVPQDQIIDNTASSLGIGKGAASYLVDPLYNTQAGKFLHGAKTNALLNIKGNPEAELAKKIAPLIDKKDLIGSLGYIAEQKGYNARRFLKELQALLPEEDLTTVQSRDLANQALIPAMPPLYQLWLMRTSGEKTRARK